MSMCKSGNVHSYQWHEGDRQISDRVSDIAKFVSGGLTEHEKRRYSVARLIRSLAGIGDENCAEREISQSLSHTVGRGPRVNGAWIPAMFASGLDTFSSGAGHTTVATEVRDLIELLRARLKVAQLGCTILQGLTSNISFPVQTAGSTLTWVAENPGSDVTDSDAAFDQVGLSPKILMASTSYSRKLLVQSSLDIEGFVRSDLANSHATEIDRVCINGAGTSVEPQGLLGNDYIGDVPLATDGRVPTYDDIVALETSIATANADESTMAYLTTPGMRGLLKSKEIFAGTSGMPIWQNGGRPGEGIMGGYRAAASSNVPSTLTKGAGSGVGVCHAIILGNWPQLVLGFFGVWELVVDPYTKKARGMVECTSYEMVDVCIKQPSAFSAVQDARLSV